MNDEFEINVSIPADDNGYILLKCTNCGEYFKLTAADCRDDGILWVNCPFCGLISESYITEDVYELGRNMALNAVNDMIYDKLKEFERHSKNRSVKIKPGKRPKRLCTTPLQSGIEDMEEVYLSCCKRSAKVSPLLVLTGYYCPFCGVRYDEIE